MKKILILVVLTVICSLAVFIAGFVTSDNTKYKNDFVRIFPPHAADVNSVLKITPGRFYLAGLSNMHVCLREREGILLVSHNMTDSVRISMDIPVGSEVSVDSQYFFVYNGNVATLRRGHTKDWKIDTIFNDIPAFTAIETISPTAVVLRTMDVGKRQNMLIKSKGHEKYVLQKQIDGLLCTDGYLQFSKEYHQIVYTYRYRNQFICLDTNLNVIRKGKTIDTTSVAKISVAQTDGKITMSKPPLVVNKGTCVDGKYLFVRSNLAARNESADEFKSRSVIDVYNILDGSYRFSFYIDNYKDSKMQEFKVKGFILVAIFKGAVIRYDLPSKYLP